MPIVHGKGALCFRGFTDGRRKRTVVDDSPETAAAAAPFSQILGASPSKLMRFHDALLYRRRLAEYYAAAGCPPTFPLLRRAPTYDPKLFSPPGGRGSPDASAGPGGVYGSSQSTSPRGEDRAATEQPVQPPTSTPLLGALFSYLHPSLAAAAAAAMAHWYLGAGTASRPPPAPGEPLLAQRGPAGQVPVEWAARLRVEDLLRARSAAAAAVTSQSSSLAGHLGLDQGTWARLPSDDAPSQRPHHPARPASSLTEHHLGLDQRSWTRLPTDEALIQRTKYQASPESFLAVHLLGLDQGPWSRLPSDKAPSQRPQASPDTSTSTSTDVPFRPYLPDVRHPTQSADQRRSPDVDAAWERADAVSCGSKTPDGETGSGDSVSGGGGGGGGGVEEADGRSSSELVNMERMVHGLKHVQTAAIEKLSKVADSY